MQARVDAGLRHQLRIRYLLAYDSTLCSAVRRIFVRQLLDGIRERAASARNGRSGAVVVAQRFGGALNLDPRLLEFSYHRPGDREGLTPSAPTECPFGPACGRKSAAVRGMSGTRLAVTAFLGIETARAAMRQPPTTDFPRRKLP